MGREMGFDPKGPIILAAGGTGGHMFPAQALADALLARGRTPILVTDRRGGAFGDALPGVPVKRIRAANAGRGLSGRIRMAVQMALGLFDAWRLLRALKPCMAIGFGGYASLPSILAAQILGIPTALHEQNAIMGRANRLLTKRARLIAASFAAIERLPPTQARIVRTGNPVRSDILALAGQPYAAPTPGGELVILITGGSQGASIFSHVFPRALERLDAGKLARLRIIQQVRPDALEETRAAYQSLGVACTLAPFFKDMAANLAACHVAIGRAGAGTVAETATAGRPALLVPYPHAMDDHQTANARALAAAGGGWAIPQDTFSPQSLAERLDDFLNQPGQLAEAAEAAARWSMPDAADRLATLVLNLADASPMDIGS
jgi:UDP-N-acetylglucosamine--N-acetylmuramyl-(pentapeptide) pyrophosphoryl-undecaprenol N-acetylglucosamine transferase